MVNIRSRQMNRILSTLPKMALTAGVLLLVACGGRPAHANAPASPHTEVTSASTSPSGHEVAGGWEKLGERVVNGRVDHDVIGVGRSEGRFTAIQLRADGNLVELFDVVITFGDGEKFSPNTRLMFDKNTRSRVIDLPGNARVIQRVDFKYGKLPGEGRASMELWGKSR